MIIAVDTGGTKTLVAAFSEKGTLKQSVKFATPIDQVEYIEQLIPAIKKLSGGKPKIISLALPNIKETSFVPAFSNLPWKNFDVVRELRPHFSPNTKIIAANDAKLGGLGEVRLMNPVPNRALYVTISTGIGTGLIIDGAMSRDMASSEGGHISVEFDGIVRDWESFASGHAIYTTYKKPASRITSKRTWHAINERFSRGFLVLIPIFQPDIIIIGGGVGTHFEKFGNELAVRVNEELSPLVKRPRFVQAIHPEEAVIYGCYFHAIDTFATA